MGTEKNSWLRADFEDARGQGIPYVVSNSGKFSFPFFYFNRDIFAENICKVI